MFIGSRVMRSVCAGLCVFSMAALIAPAHAATDDSVGDTPQQIAAALKRFAGDRRDIGLRYAQQAYERIPGELKDLRRDAALLEVAIQNGDVAFRASVARGLTGVAAAFAAVSAASMSRDEAAIAAALADFDAALVALNALFPADLRP